jgi:hypothetical protein
MIHSSPATLAAEELDLPFGFGGHAVAGRGAIPPRPYGLQDVAITHWAGALQNERTVHTSISTDDEAYLDLDASSRRNHKRIWRG